MASKCHLDTVCCGDGSCYHDTTQQGMNFSNVSRVNLLNTAAEDRKMFSKRQIRGPQEPENCNKQWCLDQQQIQKQQCKMMVLETLDALTLTLTVSTDDFIRHFLESVVKLSTEQPIRHH